MKKKFPFILITLSLGLIGYIILSHNNLSNSPPEFNQTKKILGESDELGLLQCEHTQRSESCYMDKVNELMPKIGVTETLKYLSREILPYSNYTNVHMPMHEIGHYAFYNAGQDFEKALSLLPEEAFTSSYSTYDGYLHGLFQSMFFEKRKSLQVNELMNLSCMETPKILTQSYDFKNDCFHGVGHAIMYVNNNDVTTSVIDCGKAPEKSMRSQCYYGLFMEATLLHIPEYHPGSLRPFDDAKNMANYCRTVDNYEAGIQCSHFVGEALVIQGERNPQKIFQLCHSLLTKELTQSCIGRISFIQIPSYSRNDFGEMIELCVKYSGTNFENFCLNRVKEGIKFGTAGTENKNKTEEFCRTLLDKLGKNCSQL